MTTDELLKRLRSMKVETGSLVCLGCGYEHGCDIKGCRIIREAEDAIRELAAEKERREPLAGWISTEDWLPTDEDEMVLVIVHGKPCEGTTLVGAYEFATYIEREGWIIEAYPEWETPKVTHWRPLPEPPEAGHE